DAPGALTLAEFADDPAAASPTPLLRNAGKSLSQQQLSAGVRHQPGQGTVQFTGWTIRRSLENPIAAPAPSPAQPSEGVWIGLDRRVIGGGGELRTALSPGVLISAG